MVSPDHDASRTPLSDIRSRTMLKTLLHCGCLEKYDDAGEDKKDNSIIYWNLELYKRMRNSLRSSSLDVVYSPVT